VAQELEDPASGPHDVEISPTGCQAHGLRSSHRNTDFDNRRKITVSRVALGVDSGHRFLSRVREPPPDAGTLGADRRRVTAARAGLPRKVEPSGTSSPFMSRPSAPSVDPSSITAP
jgi:hypothetical protein